jgi:DMSO/TMAO reductase YedYZ molybdopterin-dependent catalytic subunit
MKRRDAVPAAEGGTNNAPNGRPPGRRELLKWAGVAGATLALSRFASPIRAWAAEEEEKPWPGKEQLVSRGMRPLNLETPAELLDQDVTPNELHFVRNHGSMPQVDAAAWSLTIDGEVEKPLKLSLKDVMNEFPVVTHRMLIECAGNGRALFNPPARGNQWDRGGVGCAEWTGVRLKDILAAAKVTSRGIYTGHYGADDSLNPGTAPAFSRGIPIDKALEEQTIVAFKMNGKELPVEHGFPARIVVPGWAGSASQKWVTRIELRNKVHDAFFMTGKRYRIPVYPLQPGQDVPDEDYTVVTSWPVKSIITYWGPGKYRSDMQFEVRGAAWAGEREVKSVELSFDLGRSWVKVDELKPRADKYAWYRWRHQYTPHERGYHEIWARAIDEKGETQPLTQPWNVGGYMGNVVHKVNFVAARGGAMPTDR